MGETRVDLLHLLEDLRDAYPGGTEEAILTEIVANSLDSGAATIAVSTNPAAASITIVDDGAGMKRRELARYHDIASSTKQRGEGIGFAGVGIKIGLLASTEVLTETRRGAVHVATTWALTSRNRAPWKWIPPPGLVAERGTAVQLRLDNALSPLIDPGFLEAVIRRHFEPLLEPGFNEILALRYRRGIRFVLNGEGLRPEPWRAPETAPLAIRLARRRKPSAIGYLTRDGVPLPEERRGIAISTFGKVIRRGWDWLGITPASPDLVGSPLEVVPPEPTSPPGAPGQEASTAPGAALPVPEQEAAAEAPVSGAGGPPELAPGSGPQRERGERRPGRYGLSVQFESRPGDPELGRLVESTVWVNEAHPAYRRAAASRSEGYHVALAAALALATLAVEPAKEHAFVSAFLASWGDALARRRRTRRR